MMFVKYLTQMGEVLLENSEGYFMHLNRAFLYISKNQEVCIYSKYEKSEVVKKEGEFQFEASQIDNICDISGSNNNN